MIGFPPTHSIYDDPALGLGPDAVSFMAHILSLYIRHIHIGVRGCERCMIGGIAWRAVIGLAAIDCDWLEMAVIDLGLVGDKLRRWATILAGILGWLVASC